jgi:hypothetical protein
MTYPTSYEALVGRAKLQAGTHMPIIHPIYRSRVENPLCFLFLHRRMAPRFGWGGWCWDGRHPSWQRCVMIMWNACTGILVMS